MGFSSFSIHSFELLNTNSWPHFSDDAVAIDDNYVFHGLGTILKIYDKELNLKSSFDISPSNSITAVITDNTNKILYLAAGKSGVFVYDYNDKDIKNINEDEIKNIKSIGVDPGFLKGKPRKTLEGLAEIDAHGLALNGDYLYIADYNYGFRIVKVDKGANNLEFEYLGGYRQNGLSEKELTTGGYFDIDFFSFGGKDYLAILDRNYGLKIFDLTKDYKQSDKKKTALINTQLPINTPLPDSPEKIEELKKIQDQPEPVSKRDLRIVNFNTISLAKDIKAKEIESNIFIFITSPYDYQNNQKTALFKFKVFDDKGNLLENQGEKRPENLGRSQDILAGNSLDLNESGSLAFIADGEKGLQIVDYSVISNTTSDKDGEGVNIYKTTEYKNGFSYSYSLKYDSLTHENASVFISDISKGISKINVPVNSEPSTVKSTNPFYSFSQIEKNKNILSAISSKSGNSGFLFFDLSDDTQLKLIKLIKKDNPLFIKKFSESFVGVSENKILLFGNIESDPKIEKSFDITSTPLSLAVNEPYIYLGTEKGIEIYKYENSEILSVGETFKKDQKFQSLFIDKNSKTLFTGSDKTLKSLSLDNSEAPYLLFKAEEFNPENEITDIYCKNSTLFVAAGKLIYTLNSTDLIQTNRIDAKTKVNTISASKDFIYAGTDKGINIYSFNRTLKKELPSRGKVLKVTLSDSLLFSAESEGGIAITSEYYNVPDPKPMKSSSGSSSCFINSLF